MKPRHARQHGHHDCHEDSLQADIVHAMVTVRRRCARFTTAVV